MRNVFHVFSFIAMMAVTQSSYGSIAYAVHGVVPYQVQINPWFSSNDFNVKSHATIITGFNHVSVMVQNEDFIINPRINKNGGVASINNIVRKESANKKLIGEETKIGFKHEAEVRSRFHVRNI